MTELAAGSPRISILATPQSSPLALFGLYEVLSSVGRAWQELTGHQTGTMVLSPKIVARGNAPMNGPYGFTVTPNDTLDEADVVIVPDISNPDAAVLHTAWTEEVAWIRERYCGGALICSVCTGSILLAQAGILDGLEATTHWSVVDLFRDHYPAAKLVPQKILVPAGEGDRIITGGGATAWEQMALYLIARLVSPEEALRIAKIFLLGDHSDGQLPFAVANRPRQHDDAIIQKTQTWIADHYHLTGPVERMIERSGLHGRTFVRRFRAATGYAPLEYVQTLRIEEAKQLLETSSHDIESIALTVGYEDANSFRRLFKRRVGVTPARYRQRFSTFNRQIGRSD